MIELPKDAEGREIPLNTTALYDKEGKRRRVDWYTFYPDEDKWDVIFADSCVRFSPHNFSLTKPDSWEKLEEDLDMCVAKGTVCMYFSKDGICQSCSIRDITTGCSQKVIEDIVSRIRKLRGEDDV